MVEAMTSTGNDVPVQIAATIDCNDLQKVFDFWTGLLGVEGQIEEPFGFLSPPPGRNGSIWLQRVPEERIGKNRVHLDFVVKDLPGAEARVETLGGSIGEAQSWGDFHWRVCADPEGNVFDIMQAQTAE